MGFSLMAQGLTSPTLILVKIMSLLNLVAANVAGWVHLIKYAYLHDDKLNMYAACPDIPSVTNFQPET